MPQMVRHPLESEAKNKVILIVLTYGWVYVTSTRAGFYQKDAPHSNSFASARSWTHQVNSPNIDDCSEKKQGRGQAHRMPVAAQKGMSTSFHC